MEDWWVGGLMRWGTNEMGDQWDGGPLGLADDGVTNEKGDQWDGGPMIWGTNEMGDQWAPIMYWGTNELGDQWEGDQWEGGPMRGGTSERIPIWSQEKHTVSYFEENISLLRKHVIAWTSHYCTGTCGRPTWSELIINLAKDTCNLFYKVCKV